MSTSVYVNSSQDVKWFWSKALRKQHLKKDIERLIEELPTTSKIQDTRLENPSEETMKIRRWVVLGAPDQYGGAPDHRLN